MSPFKKKSRQINILIVLSFLFIVSFSHATENDIVEMYGQLHVDGTRLVSQYGDSVILRGMSLYWSQWKGQFYNVDCIEWLRDDWRCTVVRAAMAVEAGGYLVRPDVEMEKVQTVIEACIDLGMYVIVDWHDHHAEDHQAEAIAFFQQIAEEYGDELNVIYEIYNEPLQISWTDVVKPYADTLITAIREIDPDNIIIVGTPTWCQGVDIASASPLNHSNIVYSLHFYAGTHAAVRARAATAVRNGLCLFVSEFGTCNADGNGPINYDETEKWINFMEGRGISWCNWSVADLVETSAALQPGSDENGGWTEADIKPSGALIKDYLFDYNDPLFFLDDVETINHTDRPGAFMLEPNYPNPFNPSTKISFNLTRPSDVHLTIFDSNGEKIRELKQESMPAGVHSVTWDGLTDSQSMAPSGVYFCRIQTANQTDTVKMVLMK